MTNNNDKPWYENALLIAVAGSIIAIIGQLAGTIIPIMYGAPDASDFFISITPIGIDDNIEPSTGNETYGDRLASASVTVEDPHHFLRPYRFGVRLKASGEPNRATIRFSPPEIRAEETSDMYISYPHDTKSGDYLINIQATGGDGKLRNATFSLRIIQSHKIDLKVHMS